MTSTVASKRQPGDRLVQLIWQMTLAPDGKMPVPTIERINSLKMLASAWRIEDNGRAADEPQRQ